MSMTASSESDSSAFLKLSNVQATPVSRTWPPTSVKATV